MSKGHLRQKRSYIQIQIHRHTPVIGVFVCLTLEAEIISAMNTPVRVFRWRIAVTVTSLVSRLPPPFLTDSDDMENLFMGDETG